MAVLRFWAPFGKGRIAATYGVYLKLIGMRVVDFLLVLMCADLSLELCRRSVPTSWPPAVTALACYIWHYSQDLNRHLSHWLWFYYSSIPCYYCWLVINFEISTTKVIAMDHIYVYAYCVSTKWYLHRWKLGRRGRWRIWRRGVLEVVSNDNAISTFIIIKTMEQHINCFRRVLNC